MTQQEKDHFFESLGKLSVETQQVVCLMAITHKEITVNEIESFIYNCAIPFSNKRNIVREINSCLFIKQAIVYRNIYYYISLEESLLLFIHLVKEKRLEHYLTIMQKTYLYSSDAAKALLHDRFIAILASFIEQPEAPISIDSDFMVDNYPYYLWTALRMNEFAKLSNSLSFAVRIFQMKYTVSMYLNDRFTWEEVDYFHHLFTEQSDLATEEKVYYDDLFSICRLLVPGKLNDIPKQVSVNTPAGLYLHALYQQQIKQDIPQAIKLYEKGIKMEKGDTEEVLIFESLFNYAYAMALCQDDTPASTKKINAYLKKKTLKENSNYAPAYLLFMLKMDMEKYLIVDLIEYFLPFFRITPVSSLLICCIIKQNNITDTRILDMLNINSSAPSKKSFDWVELEVQGAFNKDSETYSTLQAKLGFQSLIAQSKQEEGWEKTLNLLINIHTPVSTKKTTAKLEKMTRVAYLISIDSKVIQPVLQTSRGGENWSTGKNISLRRLHLGEVEATLTEADLRVSQAILGVKSYSGKRVDYYLPFPAAITQLIGHPHVFLLSNPAVSVELSEIKPELTITKDKRNFYLSLNVSDTLNMVQVIAETNTRYKVFKLDSKQKELIEMLNRIPVVPVQAQDKLLKLISVINEAIMVHSDLIDTNSKLLKKVTGDSRIIIQLLPVGNSLKVDLYVKPFTTHPPYCRAGSGAKSILATIEGVWSQAIRSMDKELENRNVISDKLQQITDMEDESPDSFLFEKPEQILEMLEQLVDFTEIATIEWPEGVRMKVSKPVDFSSLFCAVKMKNSWLEVSGELIVGEKQVVSIQTLLAAMRTSKTGRFVELNPGEYIALTEQLRKQLEGLEAVGTVDKKGNLLLPQFSAPVLEGLTSQGAVIKGDTKYKSLLKNIKDVEVKEYDIPKQLKAELRDYQAEGFRWMARLADWGAGACLADDMGLGKTVQAISILLYKAPMGPSLVVCPASVLPNWKKEIGRFAPSLRLLVLNEVADRNGLTAEADKYDVVLATFGLLVSEESLVTGKNWSVAVIDEAHTIKNKETKSSRVAMQLQSDFRLLLTGTPIQNHLGELWNLFSFITPGLLGSFEHFTDYFITPIVQDKDKNRQKRLKQLISPFLLRRTKQAVLDELPPKTEIIQEVDLSEEEKVYYEALRRDAQLQSIQAGSSDRLKVLAEITKLRMAACNINLISTALSVSSSKTEAFMQIVQGVMSGEHRALVFSQFTTELALLKNALDAEGIDYLYLDGSVSIPNREKLVKEFQTGTAPLFLISLRAGGLGLNLTAADFVIHMDPWWNPAIEDQASDRIHRIGQTQPVTIYRLIARNTIEEKILKLHATKKDLSDSLLEGSDLSSQLTREDLLELLKE